MGDACVINQPPQHRAPSAADVQNPRGVRCTGGFDVMVEFAALGRCEIVVALEQGARVDHLRVENESEKIVAHVVVRHDRLGRGARSFCGPRWRFGHRAHWLQGCEQGALNLVFEPADRFNIRVIRCPIVLPCDMALLPS